MYRENGGRYPINKAIFEAVAVNLGALSEAQRQILVAKKKEVVKNYIDLMNTPRFESAVSQGTGDPTKVRVRFGEIERVFRGASGMISLLNLRNFKSLREVSLPLRALTLLSGVNGSGKSSVLQALAVMRQSYESLLFSDDDGGGCF
jgi:ABC-type microcin C transport system duplicated ATPase subunit YejF